MKGVDILQGIAMDEQEFGVCPRGFKENNHLHYPHHLCELGDMNFSDLLQASNPFNEHVECKL